MKRVSSAFLLLIFVCVVLSGCGGSRVTRQYRLTVSKVGEGTTSPNGSRTYPAGTVITLTATPAEGWVFQGWAGPDAGTIAENKVTVDREKTIEAVFVRRATAYVSLEADPESGFAPLTVQFTAAAGNFEPGALQYAWDFGDGAFKNGAEIESHTFVQAGNYLVKVTVKDSQNATESASAIINVQAPTPSNRVPSLTLSSDKTSGFAPLTVNFSADASDADGDVLSYSWDFGDGTIRTGSAHESHTYAAYGTYTAKVVVTDNKGGVVTDDCVITANVQGNRNPSVSLSAAVTDYSVTYTAGASDPDGDQLSYSWTFGDGCGGSSLASQTHVYSRGGIFTATVYVADGHGGTGQASTTVTIVGSSSIVGSYSNLGWASDVFVQGNFAYVATGDSLTVVNVANPSSPSYVSSVYLSGNWASDVLVTGDYAYLAAADAGLAIVNVANPAVPSLVKYVDTPGSAYGVFVQGGYAYVADLDGGLQVIDVSSPVNARIVASLNTPCRPSSVFVNAGRAYLVGSRTLLDIVDATNPTNPVLLGSVGTEQSSDVCVSGNYAYIAGDGLCVVDVSNAGFPSLVGRVRVPNAGSTSSVARAVVATNGLVYVAYDDRGLQVVDASSATSPVIVRAVDTPGQSQGVHVDGSYAYVADYRDGGLQVIRLE